MTPADIKRDIDSGALTNPVIVYERMLKATVDWPTYDEFHEWWKLKSTFGHVTVPPADVYWWLKARMNVK